MRRRLFACRLVAVARESTTNTWPVVEVLRPFVATIVAGNPHLIKAIVEAKIKTDQVDTEVLVQLLRCDFMPSVGQPDDRIRQLRAWITHRSALAIQRARVKNHDGDEQRAVPLRSARFNAQKTYALESCAPGLKN